MDLNLVWIDISQSAVHAMRNLYHISNRPFSAEDVSRTLELAAGRRPESGKTFTKTSDEEEMRHCEIIWLDCPALKSMLWSRVKAANASTFNVSVMDRCEMQLISYFGSQAHHYGWHHDVQWHNTTGVDRKLSVTVQLDDHTAYTGGDLEFDEVETSANFKAKGTVLIFPSYLRHRVTPVTSGVRRSLVAWFYGPEWR